MRSPLSQFQTPAPPRRVTGFFGSGCPLRSPCRADHSAYFGLTNLISPILSAVDVDQTKQSLHSCQCNSQRENEISVNGLWETRPDLDYLPFCAAFHFAQRARCAAAIRLLAAGDMVRPVADTFTRPRCLLEARRPPTPVRASSAWSNCSTLFWA
jgi:hypothetical protein